MRALITGASPGIGGATCRRLVEIANLKGEKIKLAACEITETDAVKTLAKDLRDLGAEVLILTGDLSKKFSSLVGSSGQVVLADINEAMLKIGRDRLIDSGKSGNVDITQLNAEKLPFADNTFDCICIAYGLRNITKKEAALKSMRRVLKPGGRLVILEFSKPNNIALSKAYDAFSSLWPVAGKLLTGDSDSYRYLVESIKMHPNQETLINMLFEAGLENCRYQNIMNGICAIHLGFKAQ